MTNIIPPLLLASCCQSIPISFLILLVFDKMKSNHHRNLEFHNYFLACNQLQHTLAIHVDQISSLTIPARDRLINAYDLWW